MRALITSSLVLLFVLVPATADARPGYRSIDRELKSPPPRGFSLFRPRAAFSVMAPGKGKRFHTVMKPKGIRTSMTRWVWSHKSADCGGAQFGCFMQLGYIVYPKGIRKNYDLEKGLDGARDGMIRQVKGTLDRSVKITYRGLPGRDVWFHAPAPGAYQKIVCRARFFMKGNKIYMAMSMSLPQHANARSMRAFIQSLMIR